MIYEHYAKRALQRELANATFEKHFQLKELAVSVTCDYITSWFDDTWPNLVEMAYSQIKRHARRLQGGERICGYCGNSWQLSDARSMLFACPKIQHV